MGNAPVGRHTAGASWMLRHVSAQFYGECKPRTNRPGGAHIALKPAPLPSALARLRKQYPNASDDERALRIMFAGTQVDEMLAAGPMRTEYFFEKPLVRLVRELASRKIARVHFSAAAKT